MRAFWACSAARWRREAQKLSPELAPPERARELLLLQGLLAAAAAAAAAVVAVAEAAA